MGIEPLAVQERNDEVASKRMDRPNGAGVARFVALQRIGRELNSTFDMDQILNVLIQQVVDTTPATHGSVILYDRAGRSLQPRAWHGYTEPQVEALASLGKLSRSGVIYRVFSSGEACNIGDVSQEPAYAPLVESTRSELTVPICYGQEVVGVLDLESPDVCAFAEDALHFVLATAEQAATAIGNAQRYAEQVERENAARRRNAQLRDLIAISQALHTGHDLNDVLDRVVQAIPFTGGFNVALLSLVSGDPPKLCRVAAAGVPLQVLEELKSVRHPLELVEQVLQERYHISRSYFLPHQESDQWKPGLHTYTLLKGDGPWQEGDWHPSDALLVPLMDGQGALLGLLSVDDPQDGKVPTRESIEMLELFASQAALAIENARLYDTKEAELDRMRSGFISMAAHELRAPMVAITGYVDLLMLGILGPVNEQQTEFLQVIKANAQRLMELVKDLLDISKIDSEGLTLDLRPVSLANVVSDAVAGMRKQIEDKDQQLDIEVPLSLPEVMADRSLMIQVLTNLLSNAHKYSPAGSRLVIRARQVDGQVILEVQDSGIGISPSDQERLFARFFRAENAVATQESGTGLGLAICREILEHHEAQIQVESELGRGTVVRIIFPPQSPASLVPS